MSSRGSYSRVAMRSLKTTLCAVAFGVICQPACAGLITVTWKGHVTSSFTPGIIDFGDIITGGFSYDDTTPLADSGSTIAIYNTAHVSSFSVHGLAGSRTNNSINVFNDQ